MQFNTNTTLIAICTVLGVLGLQFLFFWCRDRRSPWLGWYAFTFLLGAAVLPSYLLPSSGREFPLFGVANALRIVAFGLLWQGMRLFGGRPPEQLVLVLCSAVWLALCSVPIFLNSIEARVVGTSVFIVLFCVLAAWELWRDRAERLASRGPAIAIYLSFAAIVSLRIPFVNVMPFPMGARPADPTWFAAFGLVVFVHASFLVAFTLSMTRERRELEQRHFALTDPLTGLLNRRAFDDEAEQTSRRRRGARDAIAMLVLDLDDFKSINDRHGHDAGDKVLQRFAAVARQSTRPSDLLYRMGGEEFCFILPATGLAEARGVAERMRTRFAETAVEIGDQAVHATVSIGIAVAGPGGIDLHGLLAAGDAAAYEAKARGRNLCIVADHAPQLRSVPTTATAAAA